MADEAPHHVAVLLLDPGLIVLRYALDRVNSMPRSAQYPISVSLMNAPSLSESMPRMGNGNRWPMASNPSTINDCSLASRGTASVQPVQTSVATRLWMNDPDSGPPL